MPVTNFIHCCINPNQTKFGFYFLFPKVKVKLEIACEDFTETWITKVLEVLLIHAIYSYHQKNIFFRNLRRDLFVFLLLLDIQTKKTFKFLQLFCNNIIGWQFHQFFYINDMRSYSVLVYSLCCKFGSKKVHITFWQIGYRYLCIFQAKKCHIRAGFHCL